MNLNWIDVDPDLHSYNLESAIEIASNVIESSPHDGPLWKENIESKINQSFCDAFGEWANGWNFSKGEGSGNGGVVSAWCCPEHSIFIENGIVDIPVSAAKAAEGLQEWHTHLTHIKKIFMQSPFTLTDEQTAANDLYNAFTRIMSIVIVATGSEDEWFTYAEKVVSWYLEYLGFKVEQANLVAKQVIGGKFESWVKPDKETIHRVGHQFIRSTMANIMVL